MTSFKDNKKLTVINLFGGPGCGKSTAAAELFAKMKKSGYKVELIHEIAKEFVWEKWNHIFTEQDYIFAHQHRLQRRLVNHNIDYVITDSPILLSLFYIPPTFPVTFAPLVREVFDSYTNINIMLHRTIDIPYDPVGRNQNMIEAKKIDERIVHYLKEVNIPTYNVNSGDVTVNEIYNIIKKEEIIRCTPQK